MAKTPPPRGASDAASGPALEWALDPEPVVAALGLEPCFEDVLTPDDPRGRETVSPRRVPRSGRFAVADRSRGVILRSTEVGIEVAPYQARWDDAIGPPRPISEPLYVLGWSELPPTREAAVEQLRPLVEAAAESRRRSYRRCVYCERSTPPEHLFESDPPVCHGCASEQLGVVF